MIVDEGILLDPHQRKIVVINEIGGRVWELVDGHRTVGEIVATLENEYEADEATLQTDVLEFIEQLASHKLVTIRVNLPGEEENKNE